MSQRAAGVIFALAGAGIVASEWNNYPEMIADFQQPERRIARAEARLATLKEGQTNKTGAYTEAFNGCVVNFTRAWLGQADKNSLAQVARQIAPNGTSTITKDPPVHALSEIKNMGRPKLSVQYDFDQCAADKLEDRIQWAERKVQIEKEGARAQGALEDGPAFAFPALLMTCGLLSLWPNRRKDSGGLPMGHDLA